MKQDKRFIIERPENHGVTAPATWIIADSHTGVQYLFTRFADSGGMTLLVDKNGKPLINEKVIV